MEFLIILYTTCIAAFIDVLGHKLVKGKSVWKWAFYILGGGDLLFALLLAIMNWHELIKPDWRMLLNIALAIVAGFLLLIYTKIVLDKKTTYTVPELDPIINKFTKDADRQEIKLFGGDLNFLGETPMQINEHPQYSCLRAANFDKVSILCEEPTDNTKKIRYGKILTEIPNTELRFYNPRNADLKVRGRIIKVQGIARLLMYTKVRHGIYQAIETNTADSNGLLYNNIWELVWSLATKPSAVQIQSYTDLFNQGK